MARVNKYYLGSRALGQQYNYQQKTVELRKEAYRLKKSSYQVGFSTQEEVQDASNELLKAQAELSDCIYQYNTIKSSMKYSIYQADSGTTEQ